MNSPWIDRLLRLLPFWALGAVIAWISAHRQDADFGWHYRSGEYILAHGVPMHDIFTYTASNFSWINHEWLHDVVIYAGSHWLGYGVVAIFFALLWTVALGLATRWRLSWAVAALALAALLPYLGVRPVTWTVILLGVTLRLLAARRFAYLPVVLAVWANLHGGFVLGLVAIAVYAVAQRSKVAAVWLLGATLATLINPYGWGVYLEIIRTMSDQALHGAIVEWAPLAVTYGNVPYLLAAVGVTVLLVKQSIWQRWLAAGLVAMTIGATRQLPLLVAATAGLVELGYASALSWLAAHRLHPGWWRAGFTAAALVVAGAALWAPPGQVGPVVVKPYRSVLQLRDQPCRGNIFNHYSFGGYLIQWLPGAKVYIDGRMPSWSGSEGRYLDLWQRVMHDSGYAQAEFDRYNVRCALITQADTTLNDYLKKSGWRQTMSETTGVLWRRD